MATWTLLTILRPRTVTLRLNWIAVLIACWIREIFEANVARIIRPLAARKALRKAWSDRRFRFSIPRPFGVGTVRHQEQNAAAAQFCKLVHIHLFPVDRGHIDLKVPSMDDRSDRGPEIECTGIRNGVIGVDKADFHAAYLYFVTVMNFVQGVIRNVVFFEFPFN